MNNIHENYRSIGLAHIKQVRRMMNEGRYVADCKRIIKQAQRDLADKRAAMKHL